MDIYSAQRLAKMEHEQMVSSLPKVSEYEPLPAPKQPILRRMGQSAQQLSTRPQAILSAILNVVTR